jgi:hypothetical protein
MYLTHDYLVNSFIVGRTKKKLKPIEIVKGVFSDQTEGWHPSIYYGKPSLS